MTDLTVKKRRPFNFYSVLTKYRSNDNNFSVNNQIWNEKTLWDRKKETDENSTSEMEIQKKLRWYKSTFKEK